MRTQRLLKKFFPNLFNGPGDVQNYVVIYRAGSIWKTTFSKTANDAERLAESKEGKSANITNVWACRWKDPEMQPFCLRGDGSFGRANVEQIVKDIREKMKVTTRKNKGPNNAKPRIRVKAVVKETPRYKRPYNVCIAESSAHE